MRERIVLDDPLYNGNQTTAKKKNGMILCVVFAVIFAIILSAVFVALSLNNRGSNSLKGEFFARFDIADNIINFSDNGGFARFSRVFDDWNFTKGGKYLLDGDSLTLYYTDGTVQIFYYNRVNETITQVDTGYVFSRIN